MGKPEYYESFFNDTAYEYALTTGSNLSGNLKIKLLKKEGVKIKGNKVFD